jgi:branched-chain amino acid transport system substrate-binding protein
MTRPRHLRALAVAVVGLLALSACGDDGDDTTEPTDDGGGASGEFAVDTGECPDDSVEEPIEGTVKIGTTLPLSGGPAAAAFAPVAEGMKAYYEYANNEGILADHEVELTIEDDKYDANLTTPAVERLIDDTGVHLFSGMIGTPQNQATRQLLNEECYPQLLALTGAPIWGDPENFPWTTGALVPYNTETAVYVDDIKTEFPDGATAAVFYANSEFGQSYFDAFSALADDAQVDIVEEQTIDAVSSDPPTSQVNSIASQQPDLILAVPLGAQCPTFLQELAKAKAANSGWEPRVYITATCASTLLLAISGDAAEGIITVVTAKDPADPKNASDPDIVAYKQAMTDYGFPADGDFATAGAGWTTAELTVEVLRLAAESDDGLTRKSIIEAARSMDYQYLLAREGLSYKMDGYDDPFGAESMQLVQYSAATKTYTDIGELNTNYEGRTEL